jgi:hypothetical protein
MGAVFFYCSRSNDEEYILNVGQTILDAMRLSDNKYIYYKTYEQTRLGTFATGDSHYNYQYRLLKKNNKMPTFETECFIDIL